MTPLLGDLIPIPNIDEREQEMLRKVDSVMQELAGETAARDLHGRYPKDAIATLARSG